MRPRALVVLLVLVLALGAFIWFYERELPGSEEREEMAGRALPGLLSDQVRALTLERPGEEAVLLVRAEPAVETSSGDDGELETAGSAAPAAAAGAADAEPLWRYAAPKRFAGARADGQVVEDLLSALAALERTRSLDEHDPASVGLAPPRLLLTLELAGGERQVLAVGGEVPASNDMVVARGGSEGGDGGGFEEAFLVDRSLWTDLDREPGDWRSRQVFPGRRAEIERVSLLGNGAEVVLVRRDTGAFWVGQPVDDLADRRAVDSLLDALVGLRVSRFLEAGQDLGALDLAPPRGVVTVEAGGGEPFRLEVGAPAPEGGGHVLRAGTSLLVAETPLVRSLLQSPQQWQSRSLTERQIFEIEEIEVRGAAAPGEPLRIERAGTDWRRGGETIRYTPVADLLFALIEARAERLEVAAALGLRKPERVIRLTARPQGAASAVVEEIALHPPRDGVVPATVEGRAWALLLPADAVEEIERHLARVRDARPAASGAEPADPDAGAAGATP
ncbi:MAG TPA: DUF4340 domain-containing protein [Thermoanaerobaculia bacterium]|nr:DUF4340 domain-containing protein [Thermoanaerobaculia bacterium]